MPQDLPHLEERPARHLDGEQVGPERQRRPRRLGDRDHRRPPAGPAPCWRRSRPGPGRRRRPRRRSTRRAPRTRATRLRPAGSGTPFAAGNSATAIPFAAASPAERRCDHRDTADPARSPHTRRSPQQCRSCRWSLLRWRAMQSHNPHHHPAHRRVLVPHQLPHRHRAVVATGSPGRPSLRPRLSIASSGSPSSLPSPVSSLHEQQPPARQAGVLHRRHVA